MHIQIFLFTFFLFLFFSFFVIWIWLKGWKKTQEEMQKNFKAISYDVLEKNSRSFLDLANTVMDKYQDGAKNELKAKQKDLEGLVSPIKDTLKRLDEQNQHIEKKREGAHSSLQKQLDMLVQSEKNLRMETANLVKALKSPNIRGSWGQVHLRRVVELAGLLNHCDFYEQLSERHEGKLLRPDLIVKLPGQRQVIVDAKAPLDAYIDAIESKDEYHKTRRLKDHAGQVKQHVKSLASKEYWKQFQPTPEYVILFLPAEAFFSAALQVDPSLIELGMDRNVVVATPTTLIAILKAVAFGWRQDSISKDAEKVASLGKELYERLCTLSDHWTRLGKSLSHSVDAYNQTISSLESRVLVSAKKLQEFSGRKEIKEAEKIETITKNLSE